MSETLTGVTQLKIRDVCLIYVTGSDKGGISRKQKKLSFFMLIKSYNLSQLSAKILEGKTFDVQSNWQLNWAELEIDKT